MLIIDCFGHNIYIDKELVGYIQENELIITGRKFADITDDGIISFGTKEIGFIDDDQTSKNNCKNYLFYGKNRKNFKI